MQIHVTIQSRDHSSALLIESFSYRAISFRQG